MCYWLLAILLAISVIGCIPNQEQETDEPATTESNSTEQAIFEAPTPIPVETNTLETEPPTSDDPPVEAISIAPLANQFPVSCYGETYQPMNGMVYRPNGFDAPLMPPAVGWLGKWEATVQTESPDKRWIAQGTKHGLYLYDAGSLEEVWYFSHECRISDAQFSPDSQRLAISSEDGYVRILDVTSGSEMQLVPHLVDLPEGIPTYYSPLYWMDNNRLLMGGYQIQLWDTNAQMEIPIIWPVDPDLPWDGEWPVFSEAFVASHNREYLAVLSGYHVYVMDHETFEVKHHVKSYSTYSSYLNWSPDDRQLVLSEWSAWSGLDNVDPAYGVVVKIYDLATETLEAGTLPKWLDIPRSAPVPEHLGWVYALAWSPDGSMIASGDSANQIALWDVKSLQLVRQMDSGAYNRIQHLVWNDDGTRIAAAGSHRYLEVWDAQTGVPMLLSETTAGGNTDSQVMPVWMPDQQHVLFHERYMLIADVQNGEITQPELTEFTYKAALSPDDSLMIAQDFDGIYVWDVATRQPLRWLYENPDDDPFTVGFLPDAFWWTANSSLVYVLDALEDEYTPTTIIHLYDPHSGMKLHQSGEIPGMHAALSPDRARLATAFGYQVLIWDVARERLLYTLEGHIQDILTMAWSPDGTQLVSGGMDGRLIVWDVP